MDPTQVGPGTLLAGRFVLEDLLDETEGARFWRATDRVLARNVAVHVIAAEDPRSEALLNAARTSATVSDGHLLRVLDAASEDGVTYVVNEWGHGASLDRLLAEGPLSPRRAAWVAREVAEAISTAHRHGIAHGRLLPENVMVTEAGSVKLIGFVVDAVLRGRDRGRTASGRPLGEHEADVVNLAALLYAGLTGRWAGTAGSTVPPAPAEGGQPLRPRRVRAGVPRPLDTICERVLAAEAPDASLATAHEIYAALCDYIGDPSGAAPVDFEATAFFDEAELARVRQDSAPTDDASGSAATSGPAPASGAAGAGAAAAAAAGSSARDRGAEGDPEATVAGAPPLDDTGAGSTRAPAAGADPEATQAHPAFGRHAGSTGAAAGADPEATQAAPMPGGGLASPRHRGRPAPSSPPPPFPPEEPRPLFASDEPRRPRPDLPARSTGAGSGPVPKVWGPDPEEAADGDEWDTTGWTDDPPGRSWMRLALVIGAVVLVIVAVVVAFNLGRDSGIVPEDDPGDTGSEAASSAPAEPLGIASVADFDPQGDPPEENPETAPFAVDGDPSTAWRTSTYYDPINLLKDGVGLLVDLGRTAEVSEVTVTLVGSPTDVELLATDEGAGAPAALADLTSVAATQGAGESARLRPDEPVTTRYLVVWLTALPPTDGGYRGQVAEIVVR